MTIAQKAATFDAFPDVPGLTRQVAEFIVKTKAKDLPKDVIAVGKKSILDGIGLALSGPSRRAGT